MKYLRIFFLICGLISCRAHLSREDEREVLFKNGLDSFGNKDFNKSVEIFQRLFDETPEDIMVAKYLSQSYAMRAGVDLVKVAESLAEIKTTLENEKDEKNSKDLQAQQVLFANVIEKFPIFSQTALRDLKLSVQVGEENLKLNADKSSLVAHLIFYKLMRVMFLFGGILEKLKPALTLDQSLEKFVYLFNVYKTGYVEEIQKEMSDTYDLVPRLPDKTRRVAEKVFKKIKFNFKDTQYLDANIAQLEKDLKDYAMGVVLRSLKDEMSSSLDRVIEEYKQKGKDLQEVLQLKMALEKDKITPQRAFKEVMSQAETKSLFEKTHSKAQIDQFNAAIDEFFPDLSQKNVHTDELPPLDKIDLEELKKTSLSGPNSVDLDALNPDRSASGALGKEDGLKKNEPTAPNNVNLDSLIKNTLEKPP